MIDTYRTAPMPRPMPSRQWSFEELVHRGGYFGHQLHADRWTENTFVRFPERDGPKGLSESRLTVLDDVRFGMLHDLDDPWNPGRPAALPELLWYGIENPDVLRDTGRLRLYADGSVAWRHCHGIWTRHIPYLSECSGRVGLAELDEHGLWPVVGRPVAFLYAL